MSVSGRRHNERILAPMRIRVTGNDAAGVPFAEDSVTVSFSREGARISLTHSLTPDEIVLVRNLENGLESEFRVVGGFQQVFGSRREWGLEAINPASGIWGVEFASEEDNTQPKVLIECTACQNAAQSSLSNIEYEVLLATGLIARHCERCNQTTRWKPSTHALTSEMPARPNESSAEGHEEARRARRLKLTMQLRVRNSSGVEDIAETRDVSKLGLCFVSTQHFSKGDEVYIYLPSTRIQSPVETKGKVTWTAAGSVGRFYGVEYLRERG